MTIGRIGSHFIYTGDQIYFRSKKSFFDYDLVIVDLNYITTEYGDTAHYATNYKSEFVRFQNSDSGFYSERFVDFVYHCENGKPIIIISPIPQEVKFNNTEVNYADLIPIEFSCVHKEGKNIEIVKKNKFSFFFEKYLPVFFYHSYFLSYEGDPLMKIKGTDKCISFINDNILFIPPFQFKMINEEKLFWDELIAIFTSKDQTHIVLPEWSNKFYLPTEREVKDKIKKTEEEINKLIEQKETLETNQTELRKKKLLFTSTGTELEDEVKNILEGIGFEILKAEIGRADQIIKYKEKIAVIETKGLTGSAAEKNSAQLEKWVSGYHAEFGILPKGILLINAFKDRELNERDAPIWPDQMLKYAHRREHCLITGLQLLAMYFEIVNDPSKKDDLIESLFVTIGIYPNFSDWSSFVEKE